MASRNRERGFLERFSQEPFTMSSKGKREAGAASRR